MAPTDPGTTRDQPTPPVSSDRHSARGLRLPLGPTPAEAFDALYVGLAPALVRQTYLLTGRREPRQGVRRAGLPAGLAALARGGRRPGSGRLGAGGRVRVRDVALAPAAPRPPPPRRAARRSRLDRALLDALLDLPPAYRRTLLLYDGVGLDLPETAAETEASTPAAASRLLHARAAVAERLPELATRLARRRVRAAARTARPIADASPWPRRAPPMRSARAASTGPGSGPARPSPSPSCSSARRRSPCATAPTAVRDTAVARPSRSAACRRRGGPEPLTDAGPGAAAEARTTSSCTAPRGSSRKSADRPAPPGPGPDRNGAGPHPSRRGAGPRRTRSVSDTADQLRCSCQAPRISRASLAVSVGVLPTLTPAASRASFFACGGAGGAGDDGAGVAHGLALGGGEARDVADDRLGDVLRDEVRRTLLGVAADLADHDDQVGVGVGLERLEGVDVRRADDRVATDADGGREADVTELVHHLVGQRAGLRTRDRCGRAW